MFSFTSFLEKVLKQMPEYEFRVIAYDIKSNTE